MFPIGFAPTPLPSVMGGMDGSGSEDEGTIPAGRGGWRVAAGVWGCARGAVCGAMCVGLCVAWCGVQGSGRVVGASEVVQIAIHGSYHDPHPYSQTRLPKHLVPVSWRTLTSRVLSQRRARRLVERVRAIALA